MAKKSGYGADATLVAAGFNLGQSYAPGDYSKIFEKQYKGLIDASKAKVQAKIDFSKNLTKNFEDFIEKKKEGTDWLEDSTSWYDEFDTSTTDYATEKMNNNKEHYESNGSLNVALEESDNRYLSDLKNRYEKLHNKLILTKEEKKEKRIIEKSITGFRNQYNNSKANINSAGVQWNNGSINTDLSFKGEPDLKILWTQISDPNKDLPEGVKVFWDNGERFYEYSSGGIGQEVKSISENPNQYDLTSEDSKTKKVISEKDLLARLQQKETKTEGDLNVPGTELLKNINKTTTNPDNGAKVRTIKDFESKRAKIQAEHKKIMLLSKNPQDIYTREIVIGDTPRVYADDLKLNRNIDAAVINQMGIGSEMLTLADVNKDGVINAEDSDPATLKKFKYTDIEKEKHYKAKSAIIEILINPKTAEQKEIAAEEYAKYRTDMLGEVFKAERARIDSAKKIETSEEKERKERVYQQNSILIQEKFIQAEKKGFTLETLNSLPIDKDKQFVKLDGKIYLAYKTSVGDEYKMVSDTPIDLKNKQSVLNILYQNSKIRPREQNIKLTGGNNQTQKTEFYTPYNMKYLNKFIINPEDE